MKTSGKKQKQSREDFPSKSCWTEWSYIWKPQLSNLKESVETNHLWKSWESGRWKIGKLGLEVQGMDSCYLWSMPDGRWNKQVGTTEVVLRSWLPNKFYHHREITLTPIHCDMTSTYCDMTLAYCDKTEHNTAVCYQENHVEIVYGLDQSSISAVWQHTHTTKSYVVHEILQTTQTYIQTNNK